METDLPTTEPPPPPAAAADAFVTPLVKGEVWCAGCGYALRTLRLDGACPECAHPVADSAERMRRWPPSRRSRLRVVFGATAFAFGSALAVLVGALIAIQQPIVGFVVVQIMLVVHLLAAWVAGEFGCQALRRDPTAASPPFWPLCARAFPLVALALVIAAASIDSVIVAAVAALTLAAARAALLATAFLAIAEAANDQRWRGVPSLRAAGGLGMVESGIWALTTVLAISLVAAENDESLRLLPVVALFGLLCAAIAMTSGAVGWCRALYDARRSARPPTLR